MNGFDDIFAQDTIDDTAYDVIFNGAEDGSLVDIVGKEYFFTESGEEKDPDDIEDEDDESVKEGDEEDFDDEDDDSTSEGCNVKEGDDFDDDYEDDEDDDDFDDDDLEDELDDFGSDDTDFLGGGDEGKCGHPVGCRCPKCMGCKEPTTCDMDKYVAGMDYSDRQPINEKPCGAGSKCESEIDTPETTEEMDRVMMGIDGATPQSIRDLPHQITLDDPEDSDSTEYQSEGFEDEEDFDPFFESELDTFLEPDLDYQTEAAEFTFLPKFKQYPELKDFYSTVKEAEILLSSHGEVPDKRIGEKILHVILRYNDILDNAASIITLPMCVFIFPILDHLLIRFFVYAEQWGEFKVAESSAKKVVAKLARAKSKTTDPKIKAEYDAMIDKVRVSAANLDESAYEDSSDLYAMFESDDELDDEELDDLDENGVDTFLEPDLDYQTEAAEFRFLPKFKQYPELKAFYGTVKDAEILLASEGNRVDKRTGDKFLHILLRFLDINYELSSVITLPMCIFIFPVIYHLVYRLFAYLTQLGQFKVADNTANKVVASLGKARDKATDPKVKAKYDEAIAKVKQAAQELDESTFDDTSDLDAFFEAEDAFDSEHNITNDEDISPDSEGALDDGDDIDALSESNDLIEGIDY